MMTKHKTWTINEIKTAMRVAGSHWFDPDTMRFFKTRVLDEVYQGSGGIYFVTSERGPHGPRSYNVRKFTPELPGIDTVGEFNEMSKYRAIKLAKESAGEGMATVAEPYRTVTTFEQFFDDCRKHGNKNVELSAVRELRREATNHHKLMEDYCNGVIQIDEHGEYPAVVRQCRGRIIGLADAVGAESVKFGGDPRGCTVKLIWSDGETNDFGKEGWCVPTLCE